VAVEEGRDEQWRGPDEATRPGALPGLLAAADAGDPVAWERLYPAVAGWVTTVAAGLGLGREDVADVNQIVCLRLVDHLGRLRAPEALRGWVVTVTRHECYRVIRERHRHGVPGLDPSVDVVDQFMPLPDERLLRTERQRQLRAAFGRLSADCQRLLRMLSADPPLSYAEAATVLGRPVGAIGPTRGRCLGRLRTLLEEAVDGPVGGTDAVSTEASNGAQVSSASGRRDAKDGRG
jgi:RNA polymerase sigma factor (sigma-70 family)